jgi:hypothetical protein
MTGGDELTASVVDGPVGCEALREARVIDPG